MKRTYEFKSPSWADMYKETEPELIKVSVEDIICNECAVKDNRISFLEAKIEGMLECIKQS